MNDPRGILEEFLEAGRVDGHEISPWLFLVEPRKPRQRRKGWSSQRGINLSSLTPEAKKARGHHARKLTAEQVRAVRADSRPLREIGAEYGVTRLTVWRVKHYQSYGDVG